MPVQFAGRCVPGSSKAQQLRYAGIRSHYQVPGAARGLSRAVATAMVPLLAATRRRSRPACAVGSLTSARQRHRQSSPRAPRRRSGRGLSHLSGRSRRAGEDADRDGPASVAARSRRASLLMIDCGAARPPKWSRQRVLASHQYGSALDPRAGAEAESFCPSNRVRAAAGSPGAGHIQHPGARRRRVSRACREHSGGATSKPPLKGLPQIGTQRR